MIGKTIIFAYNHKHAVFIAGTVCSPLSRQERISAEVIDNYEKYSSDLIDKFADAEKQPQIAVSVDMLDTGIDVCLKIVNLVFFKPIHSKIKKKVLADDRQRHTSVCENLFGRKAEIRKNF